MRSRSIEFDYRHLSRREALVSQEEPLSSISITFELLLFSERGTIPLMVPLRKIYWSFQFGKYTQHRVSLTIHDISNFSAFEGFDAIMPVQFNYLQCQFDLGLFIRFRQSLLIKMEDFNIEVKGEAIQIFKVLSKDDHDKMPFQGIQIAKGLQRIPFFSRFFDVNSQSFISMCINEKACQFEENDNIYALSQETNKFVYVILEGKVKIIGSGSNAKQRKLGIFGIFGQTEVIFKLKNRQQCAVALTNCKCMKISQQSLQKLFNKTQFTVKCLHYLNVNTYFENLSMFQKMQIVLKMQKQSFSKGQIIKLEGDQLKNIIFVIYGNIQIVKELLINSKSNEYVIDSLQEMSSYGQYECLYKKTSQVKLKATNSGSYYSINYAQIAKTEHKLIQNIKASAISYPPNQELNFLHNVKATLNKEEKKARKKLKA